jgi:hypothetical protein
MRKLELHWQILIAIVLAGIAGSIIFEYRAANGADPMVFGIAWTSIFDYVGTIFLNALRMIIVPLITSSIIVGVAGIGSGGNLGALGGKTLLFYGSTTLAAILIGLLVINAIGPGYVEGEPARELLALDADTAALEESVAGKGPGDVAKIFQRMVPPNIIAAAAEGRFRPGRSGDRRGRVESNRAAGRVCDSGADSTRAACLHCLAVTAALCRPCQSVEDNRRRIQSNADCILNGVILGNLAGNDGVR